MCKYDDECVAILMSTYNGGNYIKNQILSILQQKNENWMLFIRDDGSVDNTLTVINEFSLWDERIIFVPDDDSNLGAGLSFQSLTKYVADGYEFNYFIFCDQDDIWLENKITHLLSKSKSVFSELLPCIIYCDGYPYLDNSSEIKSSSISCSHAEALSDFMFFNSGYQGCSIFFNLKMARMFSSYHADFHLHDDIVSLIAHSFGKVHFLDEKLMLYRQHANAVTGNKSFSFWSRFLNMIKVNYVISKPHYQEKSNFFSFYRSKLKPEQVELFINYLNYPNVNFFYRLFIIVKNDFTLGGSMMKLIIKTIIRRPIE